MLKVMGKKYLHLYAEFFCLSKSVKLYPSTFYCENKEKVFLILFVHVLQFTFPKTMPTLTFCLLVLSGDNLCKQIGPRSGRLNVGPDLDPNC